MKLPIEVRDRTVGNMLSILINGNDVATLSHDQADELANKLLAVTCRLAAEERSNQSTNLNTRIGTWQGQRPE